MNSKKEKLDAESTMIGREMIMGRTNHEIVSRMKISRRRTHSIMQHLMEDGVITDLNLPNCFPLHIGVHKSIRRPEKWVDIRRMKNILSGEQCWFVISTDDPEKWTNAKNVAQLHNPVHFGPPAFKYLNLES